MSSCSACQHKFEPHANEELAALCACCAVRCLPDRTLHPAWPLGYCPRGVLPRPAVCICSPRRREAA